MQKGLFKKRHRSFTTIELLVVLAIMAVISAMTFSALTTVRTRQYQVSCLSALKEIGTAIQLYRIEMNGYPPAYVSGGPGGVDSGAIQSLVAYKYLDEPPRCQNDDTEAEDVAHNYSSYSFLYNYYGYDETGLPYPDPVSAPMEADGDPLPAGIPSWKSYPRLFNPNPPDQTIVIRCPFHKHPVTGDALENVLRLGGNVDTIRRAEWLENDGIGYPYQYQPRVPGGL